MNNTIRKKIFEAAAKALLFIATFFAVVILRAHAAVIPDSAIQSNLERVFTENFTIEGYPYQSLMEEAADRYELPLPYILALARGESFFDPNALSLKGAVGIMQVMPATAKGEYGVSREALFDPSINIDIGVRYLAEQYRRFDDPYLALGAYNCGPGGVNAKSKTLRDDCNVFVSYINEHLNRILDQANGKATPLKGILYKLVITRFDNYLDAKRFLNYIDPRLDNLKLEMFRIETHMANHLRYQYQIIAFYDEETSAVQICHAIKETTGFSLCGTESNR